MNAAACALDELDEYIESLTIQEIFADGLMITDEKGFVRVLKQYRQDVAFFTAKQVVGKHILEIYPSVKVEESTIMQALAGKPSISRVTTQTTLNGQVCSMLENTFPIKKNGKIIGAVSFAKYIGYFKQELVLPDRMEEPGSRLFMICDIIGMSPAIQRLREQIGFIAQTNSAVLICGETGTGKEMVAQSTHSASKRKRKSFLSQNCAAIPASLLESILFGTARGSYTGAVERPGIFEIANGGTIFLDEVNSMDLNMQAKLLKVLEDKRVTRIGAGKSVPVDVRILSAMNENPQDCIASGRLRSDLFYRLSTVMIDVPALRSRREDILELAEYYISRCNKEMGKSIQGLSQEVEHFFLNYDWPGNVRELRNIIEGAFNFVTGGEIEKEYLPSYILKQADNGSGGRKTAGGVCSFLADTALAPLRITEECAKSSLTEAVEAFEKQFILSAMEERDSLSSLSAKLSVSRQTLSYKLKKYKILLG